MKNSKLFLLAFLCPFILRGQISTNLNIESLDNARRPVGWQLGVQRNDTTKYQTRVDSQIVKEGKYALSIKAPNDAGDATFGSTFYVIPSRYKGKRIVLRGYLKTKDVSATGFAGLWMRLDGYSGVVAFDNMQKQGINGTNDWKEYTIELPFSDEVKDIYVGCLLVSPKGQIWVDDLRLTIDDVPIEKVKFQTKVVAGARLDSTYWQGSKIELKSVSAQQINDLALLGRVWGFLKYHHPVPTSGKVNWDFALFPIMSQILVVKNSAERDKILVDWINSLGEVKLCANCDEPKGNFKLKVDHEWMNDPKISKELAEKLQFVYKNRNQLSSYYGSVTPLGGGDFKNEESYAHLKNPDAGFRLLSLYRFWNIVHYYFPYKYLITEDNWNDLLAAYIPKFVGTNDDALNYIKVVQELIVKIHDTHASASSRSDVYNEWQGKLYAPFIVQWVGNEWIVTKYAHKTETEKTGVKIGDAIKKINGVDVAEVVKSLETYTAASNDVTQKSRIANKLLRGNERTVKIEIERNGKTMALDIERYAPAQLNLSTWAPMPEQSYYYVRDGIGYIYLGKILTKQVDSAFKLFENARGIVIDNRNYPADFPIYAIGQYLTKEIQDFSRFSRTSAQNPGYFELDSRSLNVGGGRKTYNGKVAVLINEVSLSSAEFHTMAFRVGPHSKVIGSQTAGADGNVSPFTLPSGISTQITGIGCYYPDGSDTQRIGIQPDIEVRPTKAGIMAGKDEVLEKAIEWIQSGKD
ncbi:MAG: hypothetical protein JNL70_02845 [Saprospiraceae bacterium]|nr:hypothetical protein [Saprospiraceae bacterium]